MKIKAYKNYNDEVEFDVDSMVVSLWNAYEEEEGGSENKIYVNDADFFNSKFDNAYDAVMAVSLSGKWTWSDDYVYFDNNGYITSFNHWDDVKSPVNLDRLGICLKRRYQEEYQEGRFSPLFCCKKSQKNV